MTLDTSWGLDIYRVVLFPLFTSGINKGGIQAVDENAYEGVEVPGPTSFEFSFGSPRSIPNVSQGRVNDTIVLPSIDPKTAVMRCSYSSQTLNAMLSGLKVTTVGAAKVVEEGTDKEGQEIQCALLLSQLVSHDDDGNVVWVTELCPKATLVPSPVNYNADALVKEYTIGLSQSPKRMWGEALSLATHGCTRAVKSQVVSNGRFNVIGWLGDCVATAFVLPTDKPALTSAGAKVWNFATGAAVTGTWDHATNATTFTPTVTPDALDLLICTYEY